ncbi:MAG TPA: MBL fold metallo-hydrolase [Anaerolineae bacterium]|nr:MBL fold metallo-hydrolase [Anaerolineae bacterium]MCB0223648.1 MBL fold metallo-hydrolase [Anaerolineae bacterium]MCB9106212.1 MBL fold metallo-hydrolase [Anaerolineales bacterium]HRV92924.1 MBL fold metallo-hydrolase [Anaerolineae bacterium]
MIVKQLPLGPIQTNCYIAGCEETKEGVIIDPSAEPEQIMAEINNLGLTVKYVLLTHAHFDHMMANAGVVEATGAPLALHPLDLPLLRNNGGASFFGMQVPQSPEPDMELAEGDSITFGTHTFEVLYTPGHTPGHVSFYEANVGIIFDGDVLFASGIGRTDLPGGDYETLMTSINEKLMVLPDETYVCSGHGPVTTIGRERQSNPWL